MVITGVADKAPEQIRSLMYLDAFVPADGQCLMDLVSPETAARFRGDARLRGAGFRIIPPPAEKFAINVEEWQLSAGMSNRVV